MYVNLRSPHSTFVLDLKQWNDDIAKAVAEGWLPTKLEKELTDIVEDKPWRFVGQDLRRLKVEPAHLWCGPYRFLDPQDAFQLGAALGKAAANEKDEAKHLNLLAEMVRSGGMVWVTFSDHSIPQTPGIDPLEITVEMAQTGLDRWA